jgi:hypothetical protein
VDGEVGWGTDVRRGLREMRMFGGCTLYETKQRRRVRSAPTTMEKIFPYLQRLLITSHL